ncbi:hypothetical protein I4F81_003910 [Pyropia yezoensis]|uniref:Uncharacterized protein n=1 Tax=Pyropia yezoensis TaxID=2788 RepID=A0ACC3BUG8_PYRYE|nr:hypothetical protein I4F81_003910 [Neopyropia yezoensis]
MRARLVPSADLPAGLVSHYDLSSFDSALSWMMLSRLEIVSDSMMQERLDARVDEMEEDAFSSALSFGSDVGAADEARYVMCKVCHRSLRRPGNNMPKLSLANSNATGELPAAFSDLSRAEVNLFASVAFKAGIVVLSGGRRRALKGHAFFYDTGTAPAATRLPRVVGDMASDGILRVDFAGHRTPSIDVVSRRLVNVHRRVVDDLLAFLMLHDSLYASVERHPEAIERLPLETEGRPLPGNFVCDSASSDPGDEDVLRARADVAGECYAHDRGFVESDAQLPLALSSSVMANVAAPPESVRETQAFDDAIVVRRGGPIVPDRAAATVAGSFPDLFPCGRGGPDERRAVHISQAVFYRRLLLDAKRRFAQHILFSLQAYDVVWRASMMALGAAHALLRPKVHAPIVGVSVNDLRVHLAAKEEARSKQRHGQYGKMPASNDACSTLLRDVYATMSRFPGSNEERSTWRQQAYAMCQSFGFPSIFFAVTPDDVNSLTVMYYAGVADPDIFFDERLAALPSRCERFNVVSKDPAACALFFGRMLNVVVRDLLGWNESEGRSVEGGGVFGVTKAFFGVVETQGRGALHAHNLVWVRGMPPTVDLVKQAMVTHPELQASFEQWGKCCVVASLPLPRERVTCSTCGGEMAARETPESSQRPAVGGFAQMQAGLCRVQVRSWEHVDSCFKKGASAKMGCCRYVFPGKLADGGLDKGVLLPRHLLGCEYVNPYNPLLYAVCRCYHDVRLLFNERARAVVYYIVKYATKGQMEMEPGTADILAHFEKRLLGASERRPGTEADQATRRVLSMAYNSSSRLQIPATLARMIVLGYPGRISSHTFGCLMLAQAMERFNGKTISGVLRLLKKRLPAASDPPESVPFVPSPTQPVREGGRRLRDGGGGATVSLGADSQGAEAALDDRVARERRVVAVDFFTDYSCRPEALADTDWYKYVMIWEQSKLPKSSSSAPTRGGFDSSDDQCDSDAIVGVDEVEPGSACRVLRYTEKHPLRSTHGVRRRRQACVPRIYGPRLPDRDDQDDAAVADAYGMSALVLLTPWRDQWDLRGDEELWAAAFARTELDDAPVKQLVIMQSCRIVRTA